jgi:hypothetical protein
MKSEDVEHPRATYVVPISSSGAALSCAGTPPVYRVCEYINICPRCSCKECDIKYVSPRHGNILCCNQHMFTNDELIRAGVFPAKTGVRE